MNSLCLTCITAGLILVSGCVTPAEKAGEKTAQKNAAVSVHPDSKDWPSLFKKDLSNALFNKNIWYYDKEGFLTAKQDAAIWSDREYENFILDIEYKLEPGANSGVLIYCKNMQDWIPNAVEVQILDDLDTRWVKDPLNMKNGSLYGHSGPKASNARPAGEWNRMTITAKGKRVTVAVNGKISVDADLSTMTSAETNPDGSNIPSWLSRPWSDLPTKGHIGLQGKHAGATIYFRSVKIKQL